MSDAAVTETQPAADWMAELPTERPAEAPVAVVETSPEAPEGADVTFKTQDGKEVAFTSKARKEMQRRIDTLTAKNKELEAKTAPAKVDAPVEPVKTDTKAAFSVPKPKNLQWYIDNPPTNWNEAEDGAYDPYEARTVDLAKWNIRKEAFEEAQATRSQQTEEQVRAAYAQRATAFASEHPDFHEAVRDSPIADVLIGPAMSTLIWHDANGPDFLYYLSTHADEALDLIAQYGDLTPTERNMDLVRRKLALRLASVSRGSETETPVRTTNAPPPAGRMGAGTRTTTERAIDLAAKGSEDYDASGYRSKRREERKAL